MTELTREQITERFAEICAGQQSARVVSAGLNLVMTALHQLPKEVLPGAALSLRHMADMLDEIANQSTHH